MISTIFLTAFFSYASIAAAQCGAGTPAAKVTGSTGAYVATIGGTAAYSGASYLAAIQAAIAGTKSGDRIAVIASGSIGSNIITLDAGKIFEGCGTIDAGFKNLRGAIEITDVDDVHIPYLTMTGNPYFGIRISGTNGLQLGQITMVLSGATGSGGIGVRFDRDGAANKNVKIDTINVTGANSHAIETWNIDKLTINSVIAKDCGECGLLLQTTTNAHVGSVSGTNVGTGTGYATMRFANNNGQLPDGSYTTNVFVDKVYSRGGGRGVFCVSESGGAEIGSIDLASNNGPESILIENCYNLNIKSGKVNGGGDVRLSARDEFPNTKDITLNLEVDGTNVVELPCAINSHLTITGTGKLDICAE